jgi:hypothetical protein
MDEMLEAYCTLVGFDWHDDAAVEAAWILWGKQGRPRRVKIHIEAGLQRGDFKVGITK